MTGFELFITLMIIPITMCDFICALVICRIANYLTLRRE